VKNGDTALLAVISMVLLAACGGGGGSGGGAPVAGTPPAPVPPAPVPLPPPPDPLYVECTSTVPIDAGNPDQPAITLLGDRVVHHPLGTQYIDAGAYALDPREGDLGTRIEVSGLAELDTELVGDYLVRYNAKNSAQLAAVEAVRLVRVSAGTFARQTARDIGTTRGHMGYYERLPRNYGDDPDQRFPLIVYQHGWFNARFVNPTTVQAPLSILETINLVKIINEGPWDDDLPFIVLSPQRCLDPTEDRLTAAQTKRFIDYAINTYKVDVSRIYMGGHSQGSFNTWDYVANYPRQLAAIFPISGGYPASRACTLGQTPSWAFIGQDDLTVPYLDQVNIVNAINACIPPERSSITVLGRIRHNDVELPVLGQTGLGQGLPEYDLYDQGIYEWLLQHSRQ
jgi:predicted esterase